jgi:hypothetical protein
MRNAGCGLGRLLSPIQIVQTHIECSKSPIFMGLLHFGTCVNIRYHFFKVAGITMAQNQSIGNIALLCAFLLGGAACIALFFAPNPLPFLLVQAVGFVAFVSFALVVYEGTQRILDRIPAFRPDEYSNVATERKVRRGRFLIVASLSVAIALALFLHFHGIRGVNP